MAKISIEDRTDRKGDGKEQMLTPEISTRIYSACVKALGSLGDTEKIVEVIKISPILITGNETPTTNLISVKIVVSMLYVPEREESGMVFVFRNRAITIRMEHSFQYFFDKKEDQEAAFKNRFLKEFLGMLHDKQAEFRDLLSQLETHARRLYSQEK